MKRLAAGLPKKLSLLLPPTTFSTSSRTLSSSFAVISPSFAMPFSETSSGAVREA